MLDESLFVTHVGLTGSVVVVVGAGVVVVVVVGTAVVVSGGGLITRFQSFSLHCCEVRYQWSINC